MSGRRYVQDGTGAIRCTNKPTSQRDRHRQAVALMKLPKTEREAAMRKLAERSGMPLAALLQKSGIKLVK